MHCYLIIISLAPFAPSCFTLVSDDSVQKKCILHIMHAPSQNSAQYLSDFPFITWFQQVTSHISSISDVFVHDGAIGSSPKCDAKVRVISDSPAAVLSLSNVLWKTPIRAVSHDSCPLTVYVASSIRYLLPLSIHALSNSNRSQMPRSISPIL